MRYWDNYLEPVKYTDGFYHIGSRGGPCWLLESDDGLILIDTGMPKDLYGIVYNMGKLGYELKDVRHIVHSHGHIDHIGGTRAILSLTGAKTYIGRADADMVMAKNQLQWTNEFKIPFEEPFTPDVLIDDGDVIEIGNRRFEFYSCPGHTAGTMTMFFNVTEQGRELRAGMFGGAGLNTMSKAYMDKYGLPYSLRDDFIASIDRMMDKIPEVHVGNHLGDNAHFPKLEKRESGCEQNPFVDGKTWQQFLITRRREALAAFEKDPL
jgi:metallo-beta-lactamase class B